MLNSQAFSCRLAWYLYAVLLIMSTCLNVQAVKHENFKTCSQSGFCRRNRAYADAVSANHITAEYYLDINTVKFDQGRLTGIIIKKLLPENELVKLPMNLTFMRSGTARLWIDEEKRRNGDIQLRHDSKARKERYDGAAAWAIVGDIVPDKDAVITYEKTFVKVRYAGNINHEAVIYFSPFNIVLYRNGVPLIQINERRYMNIEHWRPYQAPVASPDTTTSTTHDSNKVEENESLWEEWFGNNEDSKPRGPESIAMDINFSNFAHVYGIPEHASSLSLRGTRGGPGNYDEPYRLYNADVFEYEMNSPMTLYGSIPFMLAQRKGSAAGVLWLNAAETWIDIVKVSENSNSTAKSIMTHWISESGVMDIFFFMGESSRQILEEYARLTGYTDLPGYSMLGYHQCRWNYVSDKDIVSVSRNFARYGIPMDTIWLDIEYTEEKKYFTWDKNNFGDPDGMRKSLREAGRNLIVIIDPHIKNVAGYPVVEELKGNNFGVLDKSSKIYEGWCWPGSSYWVDTFNHDARRWWAEQFRTDKFLGTGDDTFIWNDMNEPSVFNGPETTMPKDNIHWDGWEHRDVHNLYGLTFVMGTKSGLLSRDGKTNRPFTLTRAFFAGSQRLGAVWTGDNKADWEHLEGAYPMILNNGIAGFPFIGADVGGFFGDPDGELYTRWYQAGIFYPFFRGHAHIDSRRREPYLFADEYRYPVTKAIRLRYQLLPMWYTTFYETSVTGHPIVRPNFYVLPEDEQGYAIDDQMYIGDSGLLTKPVTKPSQVSVNIYLGDDEIYYDYFNFKPYRGRGIIEYPINMDSIPLLMRGGHIFVRRDRVRDSSKLMKWDPYTVVVVVGKNEVSHGQVYIDDGKSQEYREGLFAYRNITFNKRTRQLKSEWLNGIQDSSGLDILAVKDWFASIRIERILVVGIDDTWKDKRDIEVKTKDEQYQLTNRITFQTENSVNFVTIKEPLVPIGGIWSIQA